MVKQKNNVNEKGLILDNDVKVQTQPFYDSCRKGSLPMESLNFKFNFKETHFILN